MRKVISFDKKLEFKTMIGEVTSISLDPNLYVHPGHDEEGLLGNIKKNIYKYLQILH